jgi:DNA-binding transcriptional LysR family regulator
MHDAGRKEWLAPALFSRVAGVPILREKSDRGPAGPTRHTANGDVQGPPDREEIPSVNRTDVEPSRKPNTEAFEGIQSYTTAVLRQVEVSYEEARKDARIWSVASLVAAGLGLGMIIAALVSLFLSNREVGVISGVAGVVSGAVSGLFFRQWRAASARLAVMVDDLAELRKLDFAQHVAQTMETATERDKAKSVIIEALVNTSGVPNRAKRTKGAHNKGVRADG